MKSSKPTKIKPRPIVQVKPSSYQPSVAELREEVKIPTTPKNLARSFLKRVEVAEK